MIPSHTQVNGSLRQPEEWKNLILIVLARQSALCFAEYAQTLRIDGKDAGIPFLHGHLARGGARPLAQVELPKLHFLSRILLGALAGGFVVFDVHRFAQRRIDRLPNLRVCPVCVGGRGIHHRIEGGVVLSSIQNVQRLRMHLVADTVFI